MRTIWRLTRPRSPICFRPTNDDSPASASSRMARGAWARGLRSPRRRCADDVESCRQHCTSYFAEELFDSATRRSSAWADRIVRLAATKPSMQLAEFAERGRDRTPGFRQVGSPMRPTGVIEVHPLARDFLLDKAESSAGCSIDVARAAFEFALEEGDYRPARSLIAREFGLDDCLERLITWLRTRHAIRLDESTHFSFELGRYASTGTVVRKQSHGSDRAETALFGAEYVKRTPSASSPQSAFRAAIPQSARVTDRRSGGPISSSVRGCVRACTCAPRAEA